MKPYPLAAEFYVQALKSTKCRRQAIMRLAVQAHTIMRRVWLDRERARTWHRERRRQALADLALLEPILNDYYRTLKARLAEHLSEADHDEELATIHAFAGALAYKPSGATSKIKPCRTYY